MLSIGEGNIEEAKKDILACHRLARLIGQGAFIVEALVAISVDGMACSVDVVLAQSGKLTPIEAADLAKELTEMPPMPKMADILDVSERWVFLDCVEMMAVKGVDSISVLSGNGVHRKDGDNPLESFLQSNLTSGLDWDAILRMGNTWYDRIVETSRMPHRAERVEAEKKLNDEISKMAKEAKSFKSVGNSLMTGESLHTILSKKIGGILLALLTPALNAANQAEERGKVYSDLSQVALALDAYHSDHDNYPDRLADLAPKYLTELPKDRFSDSDLIYRREGNGYLLYSVGPNGKDDDGKSHYNDPPDQNGDDIVVRTPKEAK
jgi:hypothetical protein